MTYQTREDKLVFAQTMVDKLETALSTGGGGVFSVSIDGNFTQFDRPGAIKELEYWRKQVVRYQRTTNGRTSTIRLDGAHG